MICILLYCQKNTFNIGTYKINNKYKNAVNVIILFANY